MTACVDHQITFKNGKAVCVVCKAYSKNDKLCAKCEICKKEYNIETKHFCKPDWNKVRKVKVDIQN